jgi:methyl-accepting chemotaxis protein
MEELYLPNDSSSEVDRGAYKLSEIQLPQGKFYQAVLPVAGREYVKGSVALLQSNDLVKANNFQMIKILILVSAGCLALVFPLVLLFSKSIVRPILHIVNRMKDIAEGEGDLSGRITVTSRDEVGLLAENFNIFVEKIQGMVHEIKDNLELLNSSSSSLLGIASSLADGAGQSSEKASGVAEAGKEMSLNMTSIAAAMEEASTNVTMVSDNAQQIADIFSEVIENTDNARDITLEAVSQAQKASQQVEELGAAASEVEHVIETITEISEQVNLLALNATIEAARAGEAGKGFAVVANEIKELAKQTADATSEIKKIVSDIRSSTDGTVAEIGTITRVNTQINDIVGLISNKVEEQSAATSEIAENVAQVSLGIGEVNANVAQSTNVASEIAKDIDDVTLAAEEMFQSSSMVNEKSSALSNLSEKLNKTVERFKV